MINAIAVAETEDDERDEVDRAAAAMGVAPQEHGHYIAELAFPGRVRFSVAHIPDAWRQRFDAATSYEANIYVDDADLR